MSAPHSKRTPVASMGGKSVMLSWNGRSNSLPLVDSGLSSDPSPVVAEQPKRRPRRSVARAKKAEYVFFDPNESDSDIEVTTYNPDDKEEEHVGTVATSTKKKKLPSHVLSGRQKLRQEQRARQRKRLQTNQDDVDFKEEDLGGDASDSDDVDEDVRPLRSKGKSRPKAPKSKAPTKSRARASSPPKKRKTKVSTRVQRKKMVSVGTDAQYDLMKPGEPWVPLTELYPNPTCSVPASLPAEAEHGMETGTGRKGGYVCPLAGVLRCSSGFSDVEDFLSHLQTHKEPSKLFVCKVRGCAFTGTAHRVTTHIRQVHPGTDPAPLRIGTKPTKDHPDVSQNLHISKSRICPHADCDFEGTNKWDLNRHMKIHDAGMQARCPACRLSFSTFKEAQAHIAKEHPRCIEPPTEIRPRKRALVTCVAPGCNEGFPHHAAMSFHLQREHPNCFQFACPVDGCRAGFHLYWEAAAHLALEHSSIQSSTPLVPLALLGVGSKPQYICDHPGCGAMYTKPISLIHHQNKHNGRTPFVCRICGEAFHSPRAVRSHIAQAHPNVPTSSFDKLMDDEAAAAKLQPVKGPDDPGKIGDLIPTKPDEALPTHIQPRSMNVADYKKQLDLQDEIRRQRIMEHGSMSADSGGAMSAGGISAGGNTPSPLITSTSAHPPPNPHAVSTTAAAQQQWQQQQHQMHQRDADVQREAAAAAAGAAASVYPPQLAGTAARAAAMAAVHYSRNSSQMRGMGQMVDMSGMMAHAHGEAAAAVTSAIGGDVSAVNAARVAASAAHQALEHAGVAGGLDGASAAARAAAMAGATASSTHPQHHMHPHHRQQPMMPPAPGVMGGGASGAGVHSTIMIHQRIGEQGGALGGSAVGHPHIPQNHGHRQLSPISVDSNESSDEVNGVQAGFGGGVGGNGGSESYQQAGHGTHMPSGVSPSGSHNLSQRRFPSSLGHGGISHSSQQQQHPHYHAMQQQQQQQQHYNGMQQQQQQQMLSRQFHQFDQPQQQKQQQQQMYHPHMAPHQYSSHQMDFGGGGGGYGRQFGGSSRSTTPTSRVNQLPSDLHPPMLPGGPPGPIQGHQKPQQLPGSPVRGRRGGKGGRGKGKMGGGFHPLSRPPPPVPVNPNPITNPGNSGDGEVPMSPATTLSPGFGMEMVDVLGIGAIDGMGSLDMGLNDGELDSFLRDGQPPPDPHDISDSDAIPSIGSPSNWPYFE